jgi:Ankyrin repeats (many copies)
MLLGKAMLQWSNCSWNGEPMRMSWTLPDIHRFTLPRVMLRRQSKCFWEMGRGTNVNQKSSVSGNTALHYASTGGFTDTACLLLDHDADVHAQNKQGRSPLDVARNVHVQTILSKCHVLHTIREKLAIHMQLHSNKHSLDATTIQELQQQVLMLQQQAYQNKDTAIGKLNTRLGMTHHIIGFLFVVNLLAIPLLIIMTLYYQYCWRKQAAFMNKKVHQEQ